MEAGKKKQRNKDQILSTENKYQDGGVRLNRISNYTKCKQTRSSHLKADCQPGLKKKPTRHSYYLVYKTHCEIYRHRNIKSKKTGKKIYCTKSKL